MEERPATPFWLPDTSPLSLSEPSSSGPAFVVGPLGWRVALLVAYALSFTTTIVLSLRAFRRQYSALHSISWNRAFLVMSLIAMFLRTTQWSLLVAVQETDWSLPNSVLFLIEYTASLLFCTCYTILLYIWGEQWAFRKRFPSDPFRYLFFSLTAVVYTLALACFVCECIVDTEEATGTTQDYRNTYQTILRWMVSVQYLCVGLGFALFVVLMVREGPSMRTLDAYPQPFQINKVFSESSNSFWHPAVRQRVLTILSAVCLVLFTGRTVLLVCASVDSTNPFYSDVRFQFSYYLLLEILPFLAICSVFSWMPKIYTLQDYSVLFNEQTALQTNPPRDQPAWSSILG